MVSVKALMESDERSIILPMIPEPMMELTKLRPGPSKATYFLWPSSESCKPFNKLQKVAEGDPFVVEQKTVRCTSGYLKGVQNTCFLFEHVLKTVVPTQSM